MTTAPTPAATVVLTRDGTDGIEAWMMRRVRGMAFASGALVFPGGRVDPADADPDLPWSGSTAQSFAARLDTDEKSARALANAALRELFEESGVLLTDPVVGVAEETRAAVESRSRGLRDVLAELGCALDVSLLHPWGRWVTPPTETRRFDTWFFVATAPAVALPASVSTESESAGWVNAQAALDASARGESLVLPPTTVMLRGLVRAGSTAGVVAASPERSMAATHPAIRHNEDGTVSVFGAGEEVVFVAPRG